MTIRYSQWLGWVLAGLLSFDGYAHTVAGSIRAFRRAAELVAGRADSAAVAAYAERFDLADLRRVFVDPQVSIRSYAFDDSDTRRLLGALRQTIGSSEYSLAETILRASYLSRFGDRVRLEEPLLTAGLQFAQSIRDLEAVRAVAGTSRLSAETRQLLLRSLMAANEYRIGRRVSDLRHFDQYHSAPRFEQFRSIIRDPWQMGDWAESDGISRVGSRFFDRIYGRVVNPERLAQNIVAIASQGSVRPVDRTAALERLAQWLGASRATPIRAERLAPFIGDTQTAPLFLPVGEETWFRIVNVNREETLQFEVKVTRGGMFRLSLSDLDSNTSPDTLRSLFNAAVLDVVDRSVFGVRARGAQRIRRLSLRAEAGREDRGHSIAFSTRDLSYRDRASLGRVVNRLRHYLGIE